MKQYKSENYVFHYGDGSIAERDILDIATYQESCFAYICSVLKLKPSFHIEYFLCNTPEEVGQIYGDNEPCNGFADAPNKIYAVYNENEKCIGFHEDAHIISYCMNCPNSAAVREGLAMFFDRKWWGIPNQEWTLFYLKNHQYISLEQLLNDDIFFQIDCTISYPIVGCFTEYLILSYGIDKYLEFYKIKTEDTVKAMEKIYSTSVEVLNEKFVNYIKLFEMDAVVERRIEELLS